MGNIGTAVIIPQGSSTLSLSFILLYWREMEERIGGELHSINLQRQPLSDERLD